MDVLVFIVSRLYVKKTQLVQHLHLAYLSEVCATYLTAYAVNSNCFRSPVLDVFICVYFVGYALAFLDPEWHQAARMNRTSRISWGAGMITCITIVLSHLRGIVPVGAAESRFLINLLYGACNNHLAVAVYYGLWVLGDLLM